MQRISLLALLLLSCMIACGDDGYGPAVIASSAAPGQFPVTVVDSRGTNFTFERPPERVVAIDSAVVEVMFALGEGHRISATHEFVSYPPEAADLPRVGNAFALDTERIVDMEPDLVLIFFEGPVVSLESLGLPVLFLESPATISETAERMRLWGRILGRQTAGEALALSLEESIQSLRARLPEMARGPRIYHDEAPGWWTTGSGSLAGDVYSLLRAQNIFSDIEGFTQVSPEQIVERDPEFIVSVYPEGPDMIKYEPALTQVSAVRERKILSLDGDLIAISGPRLRDGVELIFRFLYPNLLSGDSD